MNNFEDIVVKNIIKSTDFTREVIGGLKPEFFSGIYKQAFEIYTSVLKTNRVIPNLDIFEAEIRKLKTSSEEQNELRKFVKDSFDDSSSTDLNWLVSETEKWGLQRSVYLAIVDGIEEFDKDSPDFGLTYSKLKDAISFSFDKDIGLTYFSDVDKRYELYTKVDTKFPFFNIELDKLTDGGVEEGTLSVFVAPSGGGKSVSLLDVAAKSITNGEDVLYVSFELSEKAIMKRLDANILNIHISDVTKIPEEKFKSRIKTIQEKTKGDIVVKQYPPRGGTSMTIRHLLDELKIKRNFVPTRIFIDYLGIMSSDSAPRGSNSYTEQKYIAEELRALAIETKLPVYTAAQINRGGYENSNVNLSNIADSMGIVHTADLVLSIFISEEMEESKIAMMKTLKNRFGEVDKVAVVGFDKSRMRMYDADSSNNYGQSVDVKPEFNTSDKEEKQKYKGLKFG